MRLDKKLKKKLLLNAPYVLFVYLFDKAAQGIRLATGADASQKLLHLADGFGSAFALLTTTNFNQKKYQLF